MKNKAEEDRHNQDYTEWKNWKEETRKEDYKRTTPKLMKIEMTKPTRVYCGSFLIKDANHILYCLVRTVVDNFGTPFRCNSKNLKVSVSSRKGLHSTFLLD